MFEEQSQWRQLPHFSRFLVARFAADGGLHSAAALTYMSLFALVPLLTVIYSALSLVPALQGFEGEIERWIYARFLPSFGGEISGYLAEFSRQARTLSGVGGLFLLITAYFLLVNIEANFNRLWGCPARSRGLSNFIHYWAILTLGPLLLGAALALRAYWVSLQLFSVGGALGGLGDMLMAQLPRLFGWGALTLIYLLVPNQRVNWRHAAVGGLFAALVLELARQLFGAVMGQTIYAEVYGAFAAVPLFLIWIYLVWVVVLFGAELVWALGNFQAEQAEAKIEDCSPVAVRLYLLWSGWQAGRSGAARLANEAPAGVSQAEWLAARSWLLARGFVAQTQAGDYLLSCALGSVTMDEIIDSRDAQLAGSIPWPSPLVKAQELLEASRGQLRKSTLAELFGDAVDI